MDSNLDTIDITHEEVKAESKPPRKVVVVKDFLNKEISPKRQGSAHPSEVSRAAKNKTQFNTIGSRKFSDVR